MSAGEMGDVVGCWHHSHEEDTPNETVYRPEGYPFPRSRGRSSIELRADGSVLEKGIGPNDDPSSAAQKAGRWKIVNNKAVNISMSPNEKISLLQVAPDKLVQSIG